MSTPAELAFDAERHEYRVLGQRWPSVTEILEPLQMFDGIPLETLRAAAAFGTNVHAACHLYNQGALNIATLDPALTNYVRAWQAFLSDTGAVVIASEQRVMHQSLRYAGTLDAIVRWKGRQALIDIKTGASVPRTVGPQTAAYRHALGDLRKPRYCVHLKPDATYRVHKLDDLADWQIFLSARNIHNWRNRS